MQYAVEMGSDALIYIPSFIKIGSGIKDRGIYRHTDCISLLLFSQIKESMLKRKEGR
jgi:hypothetical protein